MVLIVAAAGALLILASCTKNTYDTTNNIKPITGTISMSPITADPAVYFEVASNGNPVLLDVMFRSSTAVPMVGYTLEVHYDHGVVQLGGDLANAKIGVTPLGNCAEPCMASCGAKVCTTCTICDDAGLTKIASGPALLCQANINANRIGTLLIGVAATPIYSTIGCNPVQVTTPVRLARLYLFPASTGSSAITLVSYPNNFPTGGCAILGPGLVDQGIPCFDGGAIFTATR